MGIGYWIITGIYWIMIIFVALAVSAAVVVGVISTINDWHDDSWPNR